MPDGVREWQMNLALLLLGANVLLLLSLVETRTAVGVISLALLVGFAFLQTD